MKQLGTGLFLLCGLMFLPCNGCGGAPSNDAAVPTTASPGGAPTFGTQSGMGFSTGDALHADGAGSGLMGYNGTGKMGTSFAITDEHPIAASSIPTTQPDPVLPAP